MNIFIVVRLFVVISGISIVVIPLMSIFKLPLQQSMLISAFCGSLGVLFFLDFIEGDVFGSHIMNS